MKYFCLLVFFMGVFAASSSLACKCGNYATSAEMFAKSDLVFFGSKVLGQEIKTDSKEIFFTMHRFAKGNEALFGSDKIAIQWQGDQNVLCRGYQTQMSYLVFAVKNKQGSYSFLTDCYTDTIAADGPAYIYRGKKYTEFEFFRVNTQSAMNGLRPIYAVNLSETEAKDMARQHLWENKEFKKNHLKDREHWQATSAKKMQDDRKQTYWHVVVGYTPQRSKGEFYILNFYNSLPASFTIGPGE